MFEEKAIAENQAFNGEIMLGDCGLNMNYDPNKKILIASRHLRNDSKTIQLELRYDNSITDKQQDFKKSKKHYRSSSCDVKIIRSNSREYDHDYKLKKHMINNNSTHSRNNSRDLNEPDFRQKLTHSRNNSKDDHHNSNIKYILNYLNASNPRTSSSSAAKKHSRNHSYDQIYMPNNIKIDQELNKKFNKNFSRKNSKDYDVNMLKNCNSSAAKSEYLDSKFLSRKNSKDYNSSEDNVVISGTAAGIVTSTVLLDTKHSRTNSKDLNFLSAALIEDPNGSVLRHRRTSSKDLNRNSVVTGAGVSGIPLIADTNPLLDTTKNIEQVSVVDTATALAAQFLLRRSSHTDVTAATPSSLLNVAIATDTISDTSHNDNDDLLSTA